MPLDISRSTFDPWNDYLGVVMQQGRVHLDSDWNELIAELTRRIHAGALDIIGLSGAPSTSTGAFQINVTSDATGVHMTIGVGRMYVDGILVENHGTLGAAVWDPILADLAGTSGTSIDYTQQPYVRGATLPTSGIYLVYLDAWRRMVSYLEDPGLIDQAVGVDSTGRIQTVWQVKLLNVGAVPGGFAPSTPDASVWSGSPPSPAGLVWQTLVQGSPSLLTNSGPSGYTGQENQLYRVEIHQGGAAASATPTTTPAAGTATFKWSRENGSVATAVTAIAATTNSLNNAASQLTVASLGRDQVLGFNPGDWIEILDDFSELNGTSAQPGNASSRLPGVLHQIDSINVAALTITLDATVTATNFPLTNGLTDPTRHTRIRRWDQSGTVYLADGQTAWFNLSGAGAAGIPVPPPGASLLLENGVSVNFNLSATGGAFQTGDYWTFAARAADLSVQPLSGAPPAGVSHHVCRLAILNLNGTSNPIDCRMVFQPLANPAIHVTSLSYGAGLVLLAGSVLSIQDLSKGISVLFDSPIDPGITSGGVGPICAVTAYIPDSGGGWLNSVMLKGSSLQGVTVNTTTNPNSISWTPDPGVLTALERLSLLSPIPARLTLKGDAIWAANAPPKIFLNGSVGPDGRAFADYELWFSINSQPPVTLSASSLNFGNQPVGTTSPQMQITLFNNSNAALAFTNSSFTVTGANAADFTVTNISCGTGIGVAASCTIGVTFHPSSLAPFQANRSATLSVTTSATAPPPVALTGVATAPVLSPGTSNVSFQTFVNQIATASVTITNVGTAAATITQVAPVAIASPPANYTSAPQHFAVTNTLPPGGVLQPNQAFVVNLTFSTALAGSFAANLQISSNALVNPTLVLLTGTAITKVKNEITDNKILRDKVTDIFRGGARKPVETHSAPGMNLAKSFSRKAAGEASAASTRRAFITPDERPSVGLPPPSIAVMPAQPQPM